jgi:outer membrane protein OmpA-like peptidoglycan-associated protein
MKQLVFLTVALFCITSSSAQFWKTSEPEKLGPGVNTAAEESMPFFSPDSSLLYFTRTFDKRNAGGEFDQDIWVATRGAGGVYSEAEQLKALNNKFNNAVVGINEAGNRLYLLDAYGGKKDLEKGLAVAQRNPNGSWGKPTRVNIPNLDIDGDFYGFHVTKDEQVIIISYKGPNSAGEEDLYVSEYQNGAWSAPQHMGNVINSAGFEIAPFLSKNKDTLYFSSNGHGGLGDADIFYSVRQGDWSSWSKPTNLGAPFNTEKFDAYFKYSDEFAFWTSNREAERANIYKVRILTPPALAIACSKTDVTMHAAGDGTAKVAVNDGVAPYTYAWSNGGTTTSIAGLAPGEYAVTVTDDLGRTMSCTVNVVEPPAPVVQAIEELIYFDLNSSVLNAENIATLNKLLPELKENPDMKIFVESHCDIRASIPYNKWLSERRMKSTKKYLAENGIDPSRVTGEFLGKSQPKIDCGDNCTEEQHRINRRTVIRASVD